MKDVLVGQNLWILAHNLPWVVFCLWSWEWVFGLLNLGFNELSNQWPFDWLNYIPTKIYISWEFRIDSQKLNIVPKSLLKKMHIRRPWNLENVLNWSSQNTLSTFLSTLLYMVGKSPTRLGVPQIRGWTQLPPHPYWSKVLLGIAL